MKPHLLPVLAQRLGILLDVGIAGGRYYPVGELSAGQVCEIATAEQELLTELHSIWS